MNTQITLKKIVLGDESEFDDLLEATHNGDTKLAVVEFYAPW